MAYDLLQWERYLVHMAHVDNLSGILTRGLLCKNEADKLKLKYRSIADEGIQERRSRKVVPCGAGGTIHDYVPLFFAARPPMLYVVKSRAAKQSDIFYILVKWSVLHLGGSGFTDGNASTGGTRFFDSLDDLCHVDQDACRARIWHSPDELKRKKSAEVLVHRQVPATEFGGLVVINEVAKSRADQMVNELRKSIPVYVAPEWFYN